MRTIKKMFRKILSNNIYEWIVLHLLKKISIESDRLNSSIDKSDPRKAFRVLTSGKKLNDLELFFSEKEHLPIHKVLSYFDVYDRHLSKFRGTEITFVEVGVSKGGSLQMWKEYFGPKAKIVGIDIDPACKQHEEEQIKIFIGPQEDRNFWKTFKEEVPKVHVLLDDGGHKMQQQIVTFEEMFMHIQ